MSDGMRYVGVIVALLLGGCEGKAHHVDPVNAIDEFSVGKLFEVDGCEVYRFRDNGYAHYFTTCKGSVSTTRSEYCGKGCIHTTYDSIQTTVPHE